MTQQSKPKPPAKARNDAAKTFNGKALVNDAEVDALLASFTPAQREKVEAVAKRRKARLSGPPMELNLRDGVLHISFMHANPDAANLVLMAELASCDPDFLHGVTGHIARIGAHGAKIDQASSNFLLSVVRAVEPRDELEALLAVQMGAIHQATMMMARRLNHVETIPQQDAAERALNKLARTYAMQMETLKRYRTGGQQKVTVEHVTVNAGGQAIVGAVAHGGGGQE